ncbi:reverse transcriptase domain-containing protein [Tanacetum coccineum]
MFQQTLDGKARAWFDKLPPGSIDKWGDLQEKFLNRFGMLKACAKDLTEISKIIRRANETLPSFKERWVSESNAIPSVPELMQISSFISSHKCPELSKRFSDNIPKTVDEMLKRVDDYVRSEEAFRNIARRRPDHRPSNRPQGGHTPYVAPYRPQQNFPPPKEQYRDNRAVITLDSLVSSPKEILATEHQLHLPQPPPCAIRNSIRVWQAKSLGARRKAEGIKWTKGKWSSKGEIFPPICARDLSEEVIMIEGEVEGYLVRRIHVDEGASIEIMYEHCFNMLHLLDVCFGEDGLCRREIMKFTVISVPSSYNIILGRPGLKQLRAIPSTIHGMIKFPTPWGVATLVSQTAIVLECRRVRKKQVAEPSREKVKPQENIGLTEAVLVNPAHPDQLVTIDMTGVPKRIIKHTFNANPSVTPVSQKRRVFSAEKSKVVTQVVAGWLKARIVRPVKYPMCISNPALVKKVEGSWRMCIDFKNINSAYPKDYYPFPEIDRKIDSVMGFPFKCFLDAYKGYHQVQMAEEDEEKRPFTQTKAHSVTQKCRSASRTPGQHTKDCKSKREMIADIAETFDNLRRINMKMNPKKCSFGVEERNILGYMVTSEGIRANLAKTKDIEEMQSPKTWGQMQSLSGKLTALKRFLYRSAEKSLHFFETLKDITKENKDDYRWTEDAENASQD